MKTKAFVLLSGGLDSTTCLFHALGDFAHVEAVSVDYGQRHKKEIEQAVLICHDEGIEHHVLKLSDILGGQMLTDESIEIPDLRYEDIKGVSPTYVPFRNGTLLSLITAFAQKWVNVAEDREASVYFGAHSEDAQNWAYPDCTPEFIGAMANAIYIGTYHKIRLHTPLMWLTKAQIVTMGKELGVPFEKTWSCYAGLEKHCGKCPTCYARQDAFIRASVKDPTEYEMVDA